MKRFKNLKKGGFVYRLQKLETPFTIEEIEIKTIEKGKEFTFINDYIFNNNDHHCKVLHSIYFADKKYKDIVLKTIK